MLTENRKKPTDDCHSETYSNDVTEFEDKQEITSAPGKQAGHLQRGWKI